ncbi:MAG: hypothetical protein JNM63_13020 [Spirochaetia bacterium]|nr:hypothetical protein [Spirochaetia bacterium]
MLRIDAGYSSQALRSALRPGQVLTLSVLSRLSAHEAWLGVGGEKLLAVSEEPIPDRGRYRVGQKNGAVFLKRLAEAPDVFASQAKSGVLGMPAPAREMASHILGRFLLRKNDDNLSYLEKILEGETTLSGGQPKNLSIRAKKILVFTLPFLRAGQRLPPSELDRLIQGGAKKPHALPPSAENFKVLDILRFVMDDGPFQGSRNTEVSDAPHLLPFLRADTLTYREFSVDDRLGRFFAGRFPEIETSFYKLFYDSRKYGEIRIVITAAPKWNEARVGYVDPDFDREIPSLTRFLGSLLEKARGFKPELFFKQENLRTSGTDTTDDKTEALENLFTHENEIIFDTVMRDSEETHSKPRIK